MTYTIDEENTKQIRQPFEVHVALTSRGTQDLTITDADAYKIEDSNISTSIDSTSWSMRSLTDLQGDGFPLDGSCVFYDSTTEASLDDGKIGVRSSIGEGFTITVSCDTEIEAVTLAFTGESSGTVTATVGTTSTDYDIRRIVVVTVNDTSVTLQITNSDTERRVELASVTPGVSLSFDNENLIKVEANLRSDLSPSSPSWQISEIEVQAYWPDDISEAISNMNDDVPITYYSGYPGDYSAERKFYLSEAATMEKNVITLKGEDASHKLEDANPVPLSRLDTVAYKGWRTLYNWLAKIITDTGIKLDYKQTAPDTSGSTSTARSMVILENSAREHVQAVMNLGHVGTFWPVFVDAGIPTLTWTKPTTTNRNGQRPVWTIYESDCGDVKRDVERNLTKITTDDENGLQTNVSRSSKWSKLAESIKIEAGEPIKKRFSDAYYWKYKVRYVKRVIKSDLSYFSWVPSKTSGSKKKKYRKNGKTYTKTIKTYRPTLYGKKLTVSGGKTSVQESTKRPGTEITVQPVCYGRVYQGTTFIYPDWTQLFNRSNVGGSFTWRGDPRMQPRDVFDFVRLDGTVERCTIESIDLTHSEGGTSASITYRKGTV